MIGTTKEVFYHSPTAVCYAGTFVCTEVGEVTRDEYSTFPKHVSHRFSAPITAKLDTKHVSRSRMQSSNTLFHPPPTTTQPTAARPSGCSTTMFRAARRCNTSSCDPGDTTSRWRMRWRRCVRWTASLSFLSLPVTKSLNGTSTALLRSVRRRLRNHRMRRQKPS